MAGRGKTGSFTREQIQSFKCVDKDMQTGPPPTYPPLMTKPVTLETTPAQSYQILWKEDFLNHMGDSPYFLKTLKSNSMNQSTLSYSQKNANDTEAATKLKSKAEFKWSLMPPELQMTNRKRKSELKAKHVKKINIEDRLKELEEKERKENDKEPTNNNDSDSEEVEDEEVAADEMEYENDYGNSYFDNGESYNDEDDNLDDGPVF